MKTKKVIASAVTLLLTLLVVPVLAAPTAWTASIDQSSSPVYLNSGSDRAYYHFDLDINQDGFHSGLDEVYNYTLTIRLADDNDPSREWAFIDLPGLVSDRIREVNTTNYNFGMSILGLDDLNQTGVLGVNIYALWGDFYFIGSQLAAIGNSSSSVPLPASILLLGSGILGLFGFRRFRKSS